MNASRRERRRQAALWATGGSAAGLAVGVVVGFALAPVVGTVAAAAVIAGAIAKSYEVLTELPPMVPEHRRLHLELRAVAERLRKDLKLLPGISDQLADLIDLDGIMRSRASTSIASIRRLYGQAQQEGRLGVLDRIKGGLRTIASEDPLTELQYMIQTYRTLLGREIADLEMQLLSTGDQGTRREREATLGALRRQREAFDRQCATLTRTSESCRRIRESVRTVELQASNILCLQHEEIRQLTGELVDGLTSDVDALEQALTELQSSPGDQPRRLVDGGARPGQEPGRPPPR